MNRLAIYPGTFDPPTFGHIDIIERASKLFDRLIVSVGANTSKAPLLTVEERMESLRAVTARFSNIEISSFEGLLVEYARAQGAASIVRGLRAVVDFEYEFQIAMVNRKLNAEVDSVFLMTTWENSYLSSSVVREVSLLGGDVSSMVPKEVLPFLNSAVARRRLETGR